MGDYNKLCNQKTALSSNKKSIIAARLGYRFIAQFPSPKMFFIRMHNFEELIVFAWTGMANQLWCFRGHE